VVSIFDTDEFNAQNAKHLLFFKGNGEVVSVGVVASKLYCDHLN